MSEHTLPDSRLRMVTGTVVVDWCWETFGLKNGRVVRHKHRHRLELEPIFCWHCGKKKGYVPRGLFSWVSFLCDPCAEAHGEAALQLQHPDADFWAKVGEEMQKTYGRALSQAELEALAARGELSRGLQLLERECLLPSTNHRARNVP